MKDDHCYVCGRPIEKKKYADHFRHMKQDFCRFCVIAALQFYHTQLGIHMPGWQPQNTGD